ncbi:MAG: peptidoglycan DD-metalloendopeptidase family protein [Candidatus Sungbacteria bacterium]|nr:peptidoglycan DD-metalloendopeptidase family protein [Candidatus Sungbacteria bacterium]
MAIPRPAAAGFFLDVLKFFTGADASATEVVGESTLPAAASLPLLGAYASLPLTRQDAEAEYAEESIFQLQVTQESALVASRNPMGTLTDPYQDTIVVYRVREGDTPSGIASRFGISLNTLLWANNLRAASGIRVGDELVILPVTGVRYGVKKGDTIESIAKTFKGDADEILSFNGLAIGAPLEIGAVLIIPDGELAPPPEQKTSPAPLRSRIASLPEYIGYFMRPIFGGRKSRGIHGYNAVDLANSCGLPVLASAPGTAILVRSSGWNGGYGKYAVVTHPNGTQTLYAHLSSILTSVGQFVAQGSQIGIIGSTGNSTGCHLHFEIRGARNPF